MKILFFSDLHLQSPTDPLYLSLVSVLKDKTDRNDIVVFAGDVFDLFVGNKKVFMSRYHALLDAIRSAACRGTEIHYIWGNHDFLMDQEAFQSNLVRIHQAEVSFRVAGKLFWVAHGDLVNPYDYGYRILRYVYRCKPFETVVDAVPGSWIDRIGKVKAELSRGHRAAYNDAEKQEYAQRSRKQYHSAAKELIDKGFDFVVMGHCHDLDEKIFESPEKGTCQYINMGFPPLHHTYLVWNEGASKIERQKFPGF